MTAVSVIIPTFNRPEKTARAIASVLYQTFTDYEIILVDDGSTQEMHARLSPMKRHVLYLTHPKNLGVSAARNTGIMASSAPFIAFLDSDDYWLPEKLAVQMHFFRQHGDAHICQTEEVWFRKGKRVNPRKKHFKPSGDIFEASLRLCLVSPSSVIVSRSVLDEVGLFDKTLPACEDYDLWLRIACRYPVHLLDRPLVVKEGGGDDQLSAAYLGSMDRFRIRALVKLVEGGGLSPLQRQATLRELSRKCRIYGAGCLRRGKREEGEYYLRLPEKMQALA